MHLSKALLLGIATLMGCAHARLIPGTRVEDTKENRELIEVCEKYRRAMEERDAPTLLALAHPKYYEDSATPVGNDDFGYEGLKEVLRRWLPAVKTLRYNIEYRKVDVEGTHARVDIRYDASYQLASEMGDRWERKQNDKRLELENDNGRWLFTGGM